MRVTPSMYYKSLYGEQNNQLNNQLFDVNKQIASGVKIQYAQDDISVFTETMRLDNEIVGLGQIKKSTESGSKVSDQTDQVLNEFEKSMDRMRTLLLSAVNDTNDETSRNAIAAELRGVESNLKSLSNTSINGQYIFSGSAVDTKPISADGTYNGNDGSMSAFLGSRTQQQYNISGSELFLGQEVLVRREITSNVTQEKLTTKYPDFTNSAIAGSSAFVTPSDTIRDLMGDKDNVVDTVNAKHFFYLNGTKSDGTTFSEKIPMRDDEKINDLLTHIGNAYGNTLGNKVVDVSLNPAGEIVVADKIKGSSKLDFHMVAAVDLSGGTAADVTTLSDLDKGEPSFDKIMLGTSTAINPNLYVKEFVKSYFASADTNYAKIGGLLYDQTKFTVQGNTVSSNVPQIVKGTNDFATPSTKISEVADLSHGTAGTLDGTQFKLSGTDVNGTPYNAQIDFKSTANGGSTFSTDGGVTNYNIFNVNTPRTAADADSMTYQQLMDVVNMVVTNQIPATTNTATDYDKAVISSKLNGTTSLSYDGKIRFGDLNVVGTKATIGLYDSTSTLFADAPALSFNSNNALTVRDPKTDFFKTINEIITAVEDQKQNPDSTTGNIRNVGIGNAIAMLDDLQTHVFTSHSKVGAISNTLTASLQRVSLLELSSQTLRSSVIDTDLAQASLTMTQLTTNYQAMLSTVGKISQLSLVNYLK
ncbi:MAG: flagellar biosynthesis protein FlgL [Campylobacterales bacterium]|nr:flagellar biosynthesis protein FlgL [Campylobacterales bacterium]